MKRLAAILLVAATPTLAHAMESGVRPGSAFDRQQAARAFVDCVANTLEVQSPATEVTGEDGLVARVFESCGEAHSDMVALTAHMASDEAGRYLAAATGQALDAIESWKQDRGML